VEVRFTDATAHAGTADDGTPFVAVNPETPADLHDQDGAAALRLLVDTLCHEVEHHNESEIEAKRAFMEDFDDGYAKLAGAVINILEDNRIDYTRTRTFRGLKQVHDWKVAEAMADDEWRAPMGELEPREQALEGFTQLAFAGQVKGLSEADPEVREALADIAPLCEQVKRTDSPDDREVMAAEAVQRLTDVIPKTPDLPDWLEDMIRDLMGDLESGDFDPTEDAPDDAAFDAEAAADADGDTGGGDDEPAQDTDGGEDAPQDADTDAAADAVVESDGGHRRGRRRVGRGRCRLGPTESRGGVTGPGGRRGLGPGLGRRTG
jgi:hypothetical protein